jgi:hypothetical protein
MEEGGAMTDNFRRAGLIAAIALVGTAACGRNSGSRAIDDGLRSDLEQAGASGLELAPKAGRQVVVSAIEGGPQATPAAAPRRTRQPVRQPRRQTVVARRPPAPTAATAAPATPRVEAEAPAPQPTPQPTPAPPPRAQQRQPGVYSTEADVFRQMPWIRP